MRRGIASRSWAEKAQFLRRRPFARNARLLVRLISFRHASYGSLFHRKEDGGVQSTF